MSMLEEVVNKAKEIKTRVLTTIDAFRPKLLLKKPLTQVKLLGQSTIAGEGIGTLIKRIQDRIESVRSAVALEEFSEEEIAEAQVTHVVEKKDVTAIHY